MKKIDGGFGGVCKSMFTDNVKNGKGHKLHVNIKIHGAEFITVTFRTTKMPSFSDLGN